MAAVWSVLADAAIRDLLIERLEVEREGVGIVVGVIDRRGPRVVAHGVFAEAGSSLDGASLFEIGSITKVFTALLLADMVERGEVALDDPAAQFLPRGVDLPAPGGRPITLADLAMHVAGLPRWPADMHSANGGPRDWGNPYADYSLEQLHAFLNRYARREGPRTGHLYSNLGAGLLGHLLSLRAGSDFETLVRQRITGPLAMPDTAVTLTAAQKTRLAVGHDHDRRPVPHWDMPTFPGAGALRSSANDLLNFLAALLGFVATPLWTAMAAQLEPRRTTESDYVQGLGWRVNAYPEAEVIWHGGATGGFRAFLMFDRARARGLVMLTNSATDRNDDIGFHILCGRPLSPPKPRQESVRLDVALLERYVGRYGLTDSLHMLVTREGDHLFAQLTSQGRAEVFASGETEFFWRTVEARMTFERDEEGAVSGLILHQNGRDMPARRLP